MPRTVTRRPSATRHALTRTGVALLLASVGLALITPSRARASEPFDAIEAALLSQARDRGITWQALADAVGATSRQAVQQRAARASSDARVAQTKAAWQNAQAQTDIGSRQNALRQAQAA